MYCKVAYVVIVGRGCSRNVVGVNVLCCGYETRSCAVRSTVEHTASTMLNIRSADRSVY
jgi:hypothetical protein